MTKMARRSSAGLLIKDKIRWLIDRRTDHLYPVSSAVLSTQLRESSLTQLAPAPPELSSVVGAGATPLSTVCPPALPCAALREASKLGGESKLPSVLPPRQHPALSLSSLSLSIQSKPSPPLHALRHGRNLSTCSDVRSFLGEEMGLPGATWRGRGRSRGRVDDTIRYDTQI
ncbi:hypothetical protein LZ31DRAFT_93026 [Colletotrichum somersetense]|nr:hypothetical protein LZ31DRAFT_93026 [Colletotrichum somersetense]